jgi:hypothetical protein
MDAHSGLSSKSDNCGVGLKYSDLSRICPWQGYLSCSSLNLDGCFVSLEWSDWARSF